MTSDSSTTAEPQPPGQRTDFAPWHHLRKHWLTAVVTAVAVVIVTVFYTLGETKIYEAQATVLFDPTPPRPLGRKVEAIVDLGAGDYWNNQEYYETQYQVIRSRRVALEAVRELGLHNDAAFLQNLPPGEEPIVSQSVDPEIAAEALRGRVKVEPVLDSRLAVVKLRDANPERAQRLLNALVDTYTAQNLEHAIDSTSSARNWLQKQLDTLKLDLEEGELSLHQYKKEHDILSLAFDDKSSMLSEQMGQINQELTRAMADLQAIMARRSVLASVPTDDPNAVEATELLNSGLLTTLRARHAEALQARQALIGQQKGPNHPDVASATLRIKTAEEAILKEIKNVQRAVDRDVAAAQRRSAGLRSMLDEAKTQAHELNLLEIEYNRLRRARDNTEKLYHLVLERTKEADLTQMMRVNNISVVDAPLTPTSPVHPRISLNVTVGLLLGLFLGAAAAFLRGVLDRTLKVPDELEVDLGLTCLGLLPALSSSAQRAPYARARRQRGRRLDNNPSMELIVHHEPLSSIAEASRAIRTNLIFMAPDEPYKSLLITSAGPQEGKTTVACCIAIAMAQAGQSVVLIDCDLRRPRVHRIFGYGSDKGVTTALLGGSIDDVVHDTEVPGLSVIAAGPIPPNPAELFHTERFRLFLADACRRFDRVIVDSPPVAAVTDPAVLSTHADATLMVVRAHHTRKEVARLGTRSLRSVGGNLVGAVLNAVDFSRVEYRYSYKYYRRDGYYSDKDESELEREVSPLPPAPPA